MRTHSLKKTLNYANYSKEAHNIITKEEVLPIYKNYKEQMAEYIPIKPPPFDVEMNMKMTKKREKATLDKSNKKYIVKNIRNCTDFARSQREKMIRSLQRR